MDVIGEDHLLEVDPLAPQALHQVGRLVEGNVAVVVAVDEQYR